MQHELWKQTDGSQSFMLSGPRGKDARALLSLGLKLVWTVFADSHYEAMQRYYEYMGWGQWTTDFPEIDKKNYRELGWD